MLNDVKKKLLLEALSYIKRFKDKIVVIKYGGSSMVEDNLKYDFAQDVVLLKSLGMMPVIVHGGGTEVSKALKESGQNFHFVDLSLIHI